MAAAASANLLAEELVRITVDGMEKADQLTDALGRKFGQMGESARKAENFVKALGRSMVTSLGRVPQILTTAKERIDKFAGSLRSMASSAKLFTIGGTLGLGGILHGAASGTVEADRLGKAFEHLSRVLGNELAPYVRMATQGLIEIANAYRSLAPETREAIAKWALFGTALAASAVVLPYIVSGLGTLVGALATLAGAIGALTTPIGIAIGVLVALGAAGVSAFQDIDEAERAWLINHGSYMELATKITENFIRKTLGQGVAGVFDHISSNIARGAVVISEKLGLMAPGSLKWFDQDEAARKKNRDADEQKRLDAQKKSLEGIAALKEQALGRGRGGMFAGVEGIIERIKNAGKGGGFGLKLDVRFESPQQSWDRMQIAFMEQSGNQQDIGQAQLVEAKKGNDLLQAGIAAVQKIADKGPVIR